MTEPDDDFEIPAGLWQSLSNAEFHEICKTGRLDAKLCARLWRLTDRQGQPPAEVKIAIRKADIDKWLETLPRDEKGRPILPALRSRP